MREIERKRYGRRERESLSDRKSWEEGRANGSLARVSPGKMAGETTIIRKKKGKKREGEMARF